LSNEETDQEDREGPTTFGEQPTIDERIAELKEAGKNKTEIVQILYKEGYNTHEMMKRHLPLRALKVKPVQEESVMAAIAGTTKGAGYLAEFKTMIQRQISRNRQLTEVFYNIGLGILLASLNKSGLSMDEFRVIALKGEGLSDALMRAGETAFKALEYFESDMIVKVEAERDEARAYAAVLEKRAEDLMQEIDPKLRMEKMILTYLLSGASDPETLITLIDKWLGMELTEVRMEAIAR